MPTKATNHDNLQHSRELQLNNKMSSDKRTIVISNYSPIRSPTRRPQNNLSECISFHSFLLSSSNCTQWCEKTLALSIAIHSITVAFGSFSVLVTVCHNQERNASGCVDCEETFLSHRMYNNGTHLLIYVYRHTFTEIHSIHSM